MIEKSIEDGIKIYQKDLVQIKIKELLIIAVKLLTL